MSSDRTSRRDVLMLTATAGLALGAGAATDAAAEPAPPIRPAACTLLPQQTPTRDLLELAGLWDFQLDPEGVGEERGWTQRLPNPRLIAVPGSWNDQFEDTRDYTGVAWYRLKTYLPHSWRGRRIVLRVGSAVYKATVWIDGRPIGEHLGGHLPFAFEITAAAVWDRPVTLTIRIDNLAEPARVPPGGNSVPGHAANFPDVNYDYFPYSGLHRAVTLYAVPPIHLTDVDVVPAFDGADGLLHLRVTASDSYRGTGRAEAAGQPST